MINNNPEPSAVKKSSIEKQTNKKKYTYFSLLLPLFLSFKICMGIL